GCRQGSTLIEIAKGENMSELDRLLNNPEGSKQTEIKIPKVMEKPTAAANKANGLADQEKTISSASVGSSVFRSAATYLADNPVIKGYQK
ncbi:MAG: hypothetical protein WCG36_08490, partial [bacterium]